MLFLPRLLPWQNTLVMNDLLIVVRIMRHNRAEYTAVLQIVSGEDDPVATHQLGNSQIRNVGTEDHNARSENDKLVAAQGQASFLAHDDLFVVDALGNVTDMLATHPCRTFAAVCETVFVFGLSFEKFEHKITSLVYSLA